MIGKRIFCAGLLLLASCAGRRLPIPCGCSSSAAPITPSISIASGLNSTGCGVTGKTVNTSTNLSWPIPSTWSIPPLIPPVNSMTICADRGSLRSGISPGVSSSSASPAAAARGRARCRRQFHLGLQVRPPRRDGAGVRQIRPLQQGGSAGGEHSAARTHHPAHQPADLERKSAREIITRQ